MVSAMQDDGAYPCQARFTNRMLNVDSGRQHNDQVQSCKADSTVKPYYHWCLVENACPRVAKHGGEVRGNKVPSTDNHSAMFDLLVPKTQSSINQRDY